MKMRGMISELKNKFMGPSDTNFSIQTFMREHALTIGNEKIEPGTLRISVFGDKELTEFAIKYGAAEKRAQRNKDLQRYRVLLETGEPPANDQEIKIQAKGILAERIESDLLYAYQCLADKASNDTQATGRRLKRPYLYSVMSVLFEDWFVCLFDDYLLMAA